MQRIIINTNVSTQENYNQDGFSYRGGNPRIVANSEFIFEWNLFSATPGADEDGVDVSTWTKHTGYSGCSARLGCDNDWVHRVAGKYSGDAISSGGSIPSSLPVTITGATDKNIAFSGLIGLYNTSGQFETFLYTSRTISGDTVTFEVGSGLTAEYDHANGDNVTCSQELLFQAVIDANESDPANGKFVFHVYAASTKLQKIIDTSNAEVIGIQGIEMIPFSVSGDTITQYPSLFVDTAVLVTTMQEIGGPDQVSDPVSDQIAGEINAFLQSGVSQEIWNPTSSAWEVYSGGSDEHKGRYWLTGGGSGAAKTEFPLIQGPPGTMPVISGGSATALPAGSAPTVDIISSGSGTYSINFGIPSGADGVPPVLSGGSVTTLPAGASATAELVSSGGSTYILNLGIPQGPNGSLTMPIQPYSSDSAYSSMTCIAYNGGGYQVISGTTAGENPDNAASKFICFASKGTDGLSPTLTVSETASGVQLITSDAQGTSSAFVSNGTDGTDGVSPAVSATQTSSGAVIVTSDALGSSTVEILNGTNGISPTCSVTQVSSGAVIVTSDGQGTHSATVLNARLEGASEVVSSLTSGAIVILNDAVPVALKTSAGNLYPLEKGTISISSGAWTIDPAAYLAYDGVSAFAGPWTVYFAGGVPEGDYVIASGNNSVTTPQGHMWYRRYKSGWLEQGGMTADNIVTNDGLSITPLQPFANVQYTVLAMAASVVPDLTDKVVIAGITKSETAFTLRGQTNCTAYWYAYGQGATSSSGSNS